MAYVEYEADGKTIKARVQQKTDTLANWMANDMVLKAGEQAFVVNESGMVTNFRLGDGTRRFSELPDIIQYDQGSFVAVTTNALPTPAAEVGYSQFLTEGTYTHASGGFTVPAGKTGVGVWNGSTWALTNVVDLPKGSDGKTTEPFSANKSYNIGDQVYFDNQIWEATDITLIGESPLTHPAKWGWNPVFTGESPLQSTIVEALGLPDKLDNTIGLTTGGVTPGVQSGVIYIHPFDLRGTNVKEYTLRVSPTVGTFEVILFKKSGNIYNTEVIPHTISTTGNHTFTINRTDIDRIGFRSLTGKILVQSNGGTGFASIPLASENPVSSQYSAIDVETVDNSVFALGFVVYYTITDPKSSLVERVDALESGSQIDEILESKAIIQNPAALVIDDFSINKGWVSQFGGLVPTITNGTMKLVLTSESTQYVRIDISGLKNTSYQVKIRYRIIGGTSLTTPSIGTSYGSSTTNSSYKILPYSDTWKDAVVFVTPQVGATYIAIGNQNTRNGGGTIEIDWIEFVEDGEIQRTYYPLFNIFHNVPSSSTYLANSLNKGGNIFLEPTTYEIPSGLNIPSGTNVIGVRGKTVVEYNESTGSPFNIGAGKEYIQLRDFILKGSTPIPNGTILDADIKSKSFVGLANGVNMVGVSRDVLIENLHIHSFSGWGIYTQGTHAAYGRTSSFILNQINACGGGMMFDVRSEYHRVIGNSIFNNRVGCWISGGNVGGSDNMFNDNGAGLVLSNGTNNTHCGMSLARINHNKSYSLFAFDVDYGYDLSGCFLIDGDIHIENSQGINIHGGQIHGLITMANERGINQITNVMFAGGGLSGTTTSLSMKNNRFYSGVSSSAINNNI